MRYGPQSPFIAQRCLYRLSCFWPKNCVGLMVKTVGQHSSTWKQVVKSMSGDYQFSSGIYVARINSHDPLQSVVMLTYCTMHYKPI